MDDLGARLKQARESKGVSLREIATRTKISAVALESLERNDFTRLPGGIFGRAFVRAYAQEIDLDPEATVADFLVHLERSEREAAERGAIRAEITSDDREFIDRQRRAIRTVRIVLAVAAVVALVVLVWSLRGVWPKRQVATPPPAIVQAAVQPEALAATAPEPESTPAAAPQDAARGAASLVSSAAPAGLAVELRTEADCWIFVAADGVKAVSRMLRTGETERVEARREMLLDIGNAGAVQWTINGKAAKSMGKSGVHVRLTVSLPNIQGYLQ